MLKSQTQIIIDKRPTVFTEHQPQPSVELLPSQKGICSDSEIKALRSVCTDEWLEKLEFQTSALGQVKDKFGMEILPRGVLTGLRKILGEIDK